MVHFKGMEVYRPAEDSYLLAKYVEKHVHGRVLDMGTGSGIQAVTAAKKPEVTHVTAVDLNPAALDSARKMAGEEGVVEKMEFLLSDLFENVPCCFDWILFNTPYLPNEGEADEISWAGGLKGSETIVRFLKDSTGYLSKGGSILMLYSSLSSINKEAFAEFERTLLEEKPLFFEKLYCVQLNPS
jgi:release factor glutamine methyltransferase